MSLFNRLLSSMGMGSCEVDTLLSSDSYSPGQRVTARVLAKGGSIGQHIHGVYFSLHCRYQQREDGHVQTQEVELAHFQLPVAMTVGAREELEIPIEFQLPEFTPLTLGNTEVWLSTGLDIRQARDPSDKDLFQVVPQPLVADLLVAITRLGFTQDLVHTEAVSSMARVTAPYLQMFHYSVVEGPFKGRIEEMELAVVPAEGGLYLHAEVTRTGRGMAAAVSRILEESGDRQRRRLTPELVENLQQHIEQLLVD
ncbi:sporulation protein [Ferrimonas futtsuensis]|uniref:sporulation protein n=1 Tax=Ferrimonas futtsuensis TaxID=364764 RepID=UPI000414AEA9|nr:sporulation protein [Ferrimonas futtsuensis]